MVHPVVAAVVSLNKHKIAASALAVAEYARISPTEAAVQMDSRAAYGQIAVRRFPTTGVISGAYYIGATIKGEQGKVGIFVSKTTREPLPYPSDLTDVSIEWVA